MESPTLTYEQFKRLVSLILAEAATWFPIDVPPLADVTLAEHAGDVARDLWAEGLVRDVLRDGGSDG